MNRSFLKRAGLLSVITLIAWMPATAQAAAQELIALDDEANTESSAASRFTRFNGEVYFAESDPVHGHELWKTDGTAAGTVLVKDVMPGSESSNPNHLTVVNGILYFTADTASEGIELWRTDGTAEGTVLVKDIHPGTSHSSPQQLIDANGELFFTAISDPGHAELWKTDGSAEGTVKLSSLGDAASLTNILELTVVGTDVFFSAGTTASGRELWKTDGTPEGTELVKDIYPGSTSSNVAYLTNFNGALYFTATTAEAGTELWKSDGTEVGTVQVKDIYAGTTGSSPYHLAVAGGVLYFSAYDATHGRELWKSDGTAAGTVFLKDIYTAHSSNPSELLAVGSTLFLFAFDGTNGWRLWKSNGTTAGTTMVTTDVGAGASYLSVYNVATDGSYLYFVTHVAGTGYVQWRIDTGGNATQPLAGAGLLGSTQGMTSLGGMLYGRAFKTMDDNWALWVTDGTAGNTIKLRNPQSRVVTDGVTMNGDYYFARYTAAEGTELWASDGTPGGTRMVKDINPGAASSSPANYFVVDDTLYFAATTADEGQELWRTDGTEAGTQLVKAIAYGAYSSTPHPFAQLGSEIYFSANDQHTGNELWKSDGTADGTLLVKDVRPGLVSGVSAGGITHNGAVYFTANDGTYGAELWKTDGTEAGTTMVGDTNPGFANASPRGFVVFDGEVWFQAQTSRGAELWKSDSSVGGTVLVKDVYPGWAGSMPTELTVVGDTLYFQARTAEGYELWKSDGTSDGTVMVKDIAPGSDSSTPASLVALGDSVCFAASDATNGNETWCSDGTDAGTMVLSDIHNGTGGSAPQTLIVAGDTLFFSASSETDGTEIWQSDGTTAGTTLVSLAAGTDTVGPLLRAAGDDGNVFFDTYDNNGTSALQVLPNNPPAFVGTPSVTGNPLVDSVLNVLAAAADPDPSNTVTLIYQWKADGSAITSADAIAYRLTSNEAGKTVSVDITARDNLGATTTITGIGALEIFEALELIGSGGSALPDTLTLGDGESTTFTVSGGEGSSYTVTAGSNANGISGVVTDLGGNTYRFDAPAYGAFAGDYSVTIRDDATGAEWTMDITVPLRMETTRHKLLGGVEEGGLVVSGGVGGTTFNFEVMLPSNDGISPPVPDTHGDVAVVAPSAVAAFDAGFGNPASVTFLPAAVTTTSEFSIIAGNGAVQGETGTLIAQAPITYSGTVKGPAGEAITADLTLQVLGSEGTASDVENDIGETWQATTDTFGAFSLVAPTAESTDDANARRIQVLSAGYAALNAIAASCDSATPCELVMEYETAAADPVLDPAGGTFTDEVEITITTTTVDAVLYYTLNGDEPSAGNGTEIASGETLLLTESATLKVIATKAGLTESAVVAADYVIEPSDTGDDGDGDGGDGAPAPASGGGGGGGALAWLLLLALLPITTSPLRRTQSRPRH